jgi:hypothetical protein
MTKINHLGPLSMALQKWQEELWHGGCPHCLIDWVIKGLTAAFTRVESCELEIVKKLLFVLFCLVLFFVSPLVVYADEWNKTKEKTHGRCFSLLQQSLYHQSCSFVSFCIYCKKYGGIKIFFLSFRVTQIMLDFFLMILMTLFWVFLLWFY